MAGPTHAYIGASPACWLRYGELLAREYSSVAPWEAHGLSVDTYAVQHPGVRTHRATQSVALHLVALASRFERGGDEQQRLWLLREAASRPPSGLVWLAPPEGYELTVVDVLERDPDEHREAVERWAQHTWRAWREHHAQVRRWLDELLGRRR